MKTLKVKLQDSYGVIVDSGARKCVPAALNGVEKILIVSDQTVMGLYGQEIISMCGAYGAKTFNFILPSGENGKSKYYLDKLLVLMAEINILKSDCVIALGGGTVSDLTGFACAIFKRGIPYINVPTTLLGMADASIGGKTAVDFLGEKNMLGTIYQPKAVFCDTDFLSTLSKDQLSDGLTEIIKCGIIDDSEIIESINSDDYELSDLIYMAQKVKAKYVEKDELDKDVRHFLNLGHTFGHALEVASNFNIPHGRAVAYGILVSIIIAQKFGAESSLLEATQDIFKRVGIDYTVYIQNDQLFEQIKKDKKREGEKIKMVLPMKFGKCKIKAIEISKIEEIVSESTGLS